MNDRRHFPTRSFRIDLTDRCEFFDKELAVLTHGLFHIRIGKPGGCQAKESASEDAQERGAFTIGKDGLQERPLHLAEELREPIQPDGTHADQDPGHPVQRLDAAPGRGIDQAEQKDRRIDGDVTLT